MLSPHNHLATWILSMLASTLLGVASAETIVIKAEGLVFGPEIITANKGDTLEFHFLPRNHSVVSGYFGHPCQPSTAEMKNHFFSGFLPAKANEENVCAPVFPPVSVLDHLPSTPASLFVVTFFFFSML